MTNVRAGQRGIEPSRKTLTSLDRRINQPTVLLPLYPHTSRVLPVSWMSLVHFMKSSKTETIGCIGDILAERPPHALRARNPSFPASTGPLRVDVDGVDACPPAEASSSRRRPVHSDSSENE